MNYEGFNNYDEKMQTLAERHMELFPEVPDEQLPDHFEKWLESMPEEEELEIEGTI